MKIQKAVLLTSLLLGLLGESAIAGAGDDKTPAKPKPYTLETCAVCSMKLGSMGGKPVTFTYKDREIKVCDAGEQKEFEKTPDKFLKKIEEAEAKAKEKDKK
jgi:nitrous oxide reductase accessory protein NosL